MGSLFKSKTSTTNSKTETTPWAPQQGYLKSGFQQASDALGSALTDTGGITNTNVGMTPEQLQSYQSMGNYSRGLMPTANYLTNAGNQAVGTGGAYAGTAGALTSQGASMAGYGQSAGRTTQGLTNQLQSNLGYGQQAGSGYNTLSQSGQNLMQSGAGFGTNAQNILNQSKQDPTQTIVNNAGQYMNNDLVQSQIDSVIADAQKGFGKQVGQINSAAAGTGNINSTRAGTLEAYAQDDAQDRIAQASSDIRNNAYNTGLSLASSNYQQGVQNQLGANQQVASAYGTGADVLGQGASGQAGLYGTGVNGILSGASQMAGLYGTGMNTALSGNSQLGNYFGQGQGLAQAGASIGTNAQSNNVAAQEAIQAQNQKQLEGKLAAAGLPLSLVQQYLQTVGGNYGGTATGQQQQPTASIFQQLVGGAATAAGAYAGMG